MDTPVLSPPPTPQTLDIAALTRVPIMRLESYVSLIRTLRGVSFEHESLVPALQRMKEALTEGEQLLVARLGDEVDLQLERNFDYFVDRVWGIVNSELEFWSVYEHPGVHLLSETQREAIELDKQRELAQVAEDLGERMFGARNDAEFLRRKYTMQVAAMRSRLDLIEQKQLSETFAELVSPRVAKLLEVVQTRYEQMVDERSSRSRDLGNRRELNVRLRRAIQLYALAVVGTVDDADPSSAERIERALRPLTSLGKVSRTVTSTEAEDEPELEPEAELEGEPELDAESEAN